MANNNVKYKQFNCSKPLTECWDNEQSNRPTIKQVVERLKEIKENPIFINVNTNSENITEESNKPITCDDHEGCNIMFQIKVMKHASNELMVNRLSPLVLNLHDKLSNIRKEFKKDNDIMNDTFSFANKPDPDFVKAVEDAIESKDPRKFRKITEEFGKFVPKEEVILGARAYFVDANSGDSSKNYTRYTNFKLIGGKKFISKDFNEKEWHNSLEEFRNWECIKIKNPISIFYLLSEDLRKEILLLVGKKILYLNTESYEYKLLKPGSHKILELKNIPKEILEILKDKAADCSIFATVVDEKKVNNDIFNCQIFWPPNQEPKLIIH
ncbi:hypothetical protein RhiirC2_794267, partial [Rhizophagus irregularis]